MPELSFFSEGHRLLWKLNLILAGISYIKMLIIDAKKWYNVQCLHTNKIYRFYHGLENFDLKKYLKLKVWK